MSAPVSPELLARARALDAEAIKAGEQSAQGRELRTQAARLRVEAIGPRPYPVEICVTCLRLTGWRTAQGQCDACARHAAIRAADAAAAGFASVAPVAPAAPAAALAPPPLRARLAARLGRGQALSEALAHAWLQRVEPGETGPIDPEEHYELEAAVRDELERLDGAGVLVRFATATHRFDEGRWQRLATTRIGRSLMPNPAEFAAELPIETLVEAWGDYQQAVAAINRASWSELAARRDERLAQQRAREEALHTQEHTSDLLHE